MGPVDVATHGELEMLERSAQRAVAERFPIALIVMDPELTIVWASPVSAAVIGHPGRDITGLTIIDLVHPDDLERIAPMVMGVLSQSAQTLISPAAAARVEVPVRVLSADGRWQPMAAVGRVLDDDGNLVAVIRPASERHATDRVLDCLARGGGLGEAMESIAGLLRAQFGVGRAWTVHDLDGTPRTVGDAGGPDPTLAAELLDAARPATVRVSDLSDGSRWVVPVRSGNGESLLAVLVLPSPRDDAPNPYDLHVLERTAGLASLACARIMDHRDLQRAATTDHLTGALNRSAFEERVAATARQPDQMPVALLFADLDGFKIVNDELGHAAGDALLTLLARRISAAVRSDDVVARLGGDEFAVLCPSMDEPLADAARRRVEHAVEAPFAVAGLQLEVRASVGVAVAHDSDQLGDLLSRSDADMYRRKRSGGVDATRSAPT